MRQSGIEARDNCCSCAAQGTAPCEECRQVDEEEALAAEQKKQADAEAAESRGEKPARKPRSAG